MRRHSPSALLSESIAAWVRLVVFRTVASSLACIFCTESSQASSASVIGPGPVLVGIGVGVLVVGAVGGGVALAAGLPAPPPQPATSRASATAATVQPAWRGATERMVDPP